MANDVSIGEADNESVLGGVVLVLVLSHQTRAGVIISFSLPATAVLDLIPLVVSAVLLNFDERLWGEDVNQYIPETLNSAFSHHLDKVSALAHGQTALGV